MTRSNARTRAATARKSRPKDIAWATRARATKDVDRKVRNMPARTNASLYASERADSRLQCSVVRRVIVRGSSIDAIGNTGVGGCGRSGDIGLYLGCTSDAPTIGRASPDHPCQRKDG